MKALVTKNKYDQFNIKMMEFKKDLKLVDGWIEAFSHVGSTLVRDDSKAAFWAHPNSQSDRPHRVNDWQRNKKLRSNYNDHYYQHTSWNSNPRDNLSRSQGNNNMGNQNPPGNSVETIKPPRPTLEEISKIQLKDLCPHCGWRVESNSKHSRSCRYQNHPDYNPDRTSGIGLRPRL